MKKILALMLSTLSVQIYAQAVNAYGPGGPDPAMRAAAAAFEKKTGIKVAVSAGPTEKWEADAKKNGDLIFTGSEIMLDAFTDQFGLTQSKALYLRPSVILVRKGNPKKIKGLDSLFKEGINVMVVQGAGQVGMWEDLTGRTKNVSNIRALRKNMKVIAKNTALALAEWKQNPSLDAWIIWNHWYERAKENTEMIAVEPNYTIYRAVSIGFTKKGSTNKNAAAFFEYLDSPEAELIFKQHGWQKKW